MGVAIVIDQGNFHIKDNGSNYTNIQELTNLSKSAEFHLYRSLDFVSDPISWNRTDSESLQNFRSIAVLHVSVALSQAENLKKAKMEKLLAPPCNYSDLLQFS